MSMTGMRIAVTSAYPGDKWSDKVKKMSDHQVQAIYFRMRREGKI